MEEAESQAFDSQIEERIANGHIPDLRLVKECHYFYNNPWRHPDYVKLDMIEQFELINSWIKRYYDCRKDIRILEIGCGPGYLSLELARQGYNVTGIDISKASIQVAINYAASDPWKLNRGKINYMCSSIFDFKDCGFDVVVFLGALHHFRNQEGVLTKVEELLKLNGVVIVHEPTRDRVTKGNAAIMFLIQNLLSAGKGYYKDFLPVKTDSIEREVTKIYNSLRYETENGEKLQSANDNEAGYKEMMRVLEKKFETVHFEERYAFFHEIIGGLRFDQERNSEVASFIHDIDNYLCKLGVIQSTEFLFVGKKR